MKIYHKVSNVLLIDSDDLKGANLKGANLKGIDLQGVDLQEANLRGADLDFSCFPLHCGSFNIKADDRLVAQLLYHAVKLDVSGCSGGVQEAISYIRQMAISDLFCEYRPDIKGD